MADSDSEIEFNRQHSNREMEEDRPATDTEEIIQQQEHDEPDRAASVLSSIDDIPELEDAPVQQPRSRRTRENDYLGASMDPHARGDLSGNARRPISHTSTPMKPQTYNGDEDWESYLSHFEVCAELGRWSLYDKVLYLAACLRGNAQVYYMTLTPVERSSYHTLTVKLGQRFGNLRQQPMWVSKFETRMRKQNESIAELGDDIRRIAQRAYSDMDHGAREVLSLNQLYKSVSPDLRYKCISKNCTSVTKAVSIIEIYEGILGEDSSKNKSVRQATAELDKDLQVKESNNNSKDDNTLQGTLRLLQNCIERLNRQCNNQAQGDQGTRNWNSQRLCYTCYSPHHLRRECPHKERNRREQQLLQRPHTRPHQQPRGQYYDGNQQENYRPSTQ